MTNKQFIKYLIQEFSEKRNDVVDMCEEFLETGKTTLKPESRLIYADIPHTKISVEYDTLTTQLNFTDSTYMNFWNVCDNHRYEG